MAGACSAHGGDENYVQNLIAVPGGKVPHRRLRCRWKDNINMETGLYDVNLFGFGHGPVVGSCVFGNEHSGCTKDVDFLDMLIVLSASQEGVTELV
jgi:hypothetical protein